jgi:hypothetical protein
LSGEAAQSGLPFALVTTPHPRGRGQTAALLQSESPPLQFEPLMDHKAGHLKALAEQGNDRSSNRVLRSGGNVRHPDVVFLNIARPIRRLGADKESGHSRASLSSRALSETMGDLVNLRIVRKRTARRQAAQRAAENRLAFGRTKSERALETARAEKARRTLDAARIEPGDRE